MKKTFALMLPALAAAALANPAAAFPLSPPSTHFTALGALTLSVPGTTQTITCKIKASGATTAAGVGKLHIFLFLGPPACTRIAATGLPWSAHGITATTGTLSIAGLTGFAPCTGPATAPMTTTGGTWTFTNDPLPTGCLLNGSLRTTPPIT